MKVKILKTNNKNAWYYGKEGQIFNVLEIHDSFYRLGIGEGYRLDIFKNLCKVVK